MLHRLVKFVSPDVLELTKSGALRFGSLRDYQKSEGIVEDRLSDKLEGHFGHFVDRDLKGETFHLGTNIFKVTTTRAPGGTGKAIYIDNTADALIFCAQAGDYSAEDHQRFVENGNPSCTCYIVFDFDTFREAVQGLMNHIAPSNVLALAGTVEYSEKEIGVSLRDLERLSQTQSPEERKDRLAKIIFVKPARFVHEREYRIALVSNGCDPSGFHRPLLVRDTSVEVQEAFKRSVLSWGQLP